MATKLFYQISLAEDTQTLDEVVVVGFGTQKKVNLTGAVATVDKKTLESRPVTSVSQALQGVMPGLNIDMNDKGGRLDYNPTMNIRGTGNLNTGSSASPLVLIDGAEGDINSLNPQDIANISVLKRCCRICHLRFTRSIWRNLGYNQIRRSRKSHHSVFKQFQMVTPHQHS